MLSALAPSLHEGEDHSRRGPSALSLIDLAQPDDAAQEPQYYGLLSDLPPGVELEELEPSRAVVDLSGASASEARVQEGGNANRVPLPTASVSRMRDVSPRPAPVIPQNARGFGSDDLFRQSQGGDSTGILAAVLPPEIRQHLPDIPDCMGGSMDEAAGEIVVPQSQAVSSVPSHAADPLEEQHVAAAVSRATEGRWVPTYMRQQLAANGHNVMPAAPNAHEYRSHEPPPSLAETFEGMGQDLGDTVHAAMAFVIGFVSSLGRHCQACSSDAATRVHEEVMGFSDGICQGDSYEEDHCLNEPG